MDTVLLPGEHMFDAGTHGGLGGVGACGAGGQGRLHELLPWEWKRLREETPARKAA